MPRSEPAFRMSGFHATIVALSASFEVRFPEPIPFDQPALQDLSKRLTNPSGLGIPPSSIRLHLEDALFGYRLVGRLFGENGRIERDSERVRLHLGNARSKSDLETVLQVAALFHREVAFGLAKDATFSPYFHAQFSDQESRDTFLNRFRLLAETVHPGFFGRLMLPDWPEPVRVQAEQSYIFPHSIFVNLETTYSNAQDDWDKFLPALITVCEHATRALSLDVDPLTEKIEP